MPCAFPLASRITVAILMLVQFMFGIFGIIGGLALMVQDDDDLMLTTGLVDVIVYGVVTVTGLISIIGGIVAACSRTPGGLRCGAVALLVGSVLSFLAQVALMIIFGVERQEGAYWTNWTTIVLFILSFFSVVFSIPALRV